MFACLRVLFFMSEKVALTKVQRSVQMSTKNTDGAGQIRCCFFVFFFLLSNRQNNQPKNKEMNCLISKILFFILLLLLFIITSTKRSPTFP